MTAAVRTRAVLIDLDGTLLDTVGDLSAAANRMLAELDRPSRTVEQVRTYVGKGIPMLVRRALAGDLSGNVDETLAARALPIFERCYAEESGRSAIVYPGVRAGLAQLRALGLRIGCMTNKAARFTHDLLARNALADWFDLVVCGDSLPRRKPDPLPVLYSGERLGVPPSSIVVIGDSANDVQAARAAGARVFCVPYGYNEGEPVEQLDCERIVGTIEEAAQVLAAECA